MANIDILIEYEEFVRVHEELTSKEEIFTTVKSIFLSQSKKHGVFDVINLIEAVGENFSYTLIIEGNNKRKFANFIFEYLFKIHRCRRAIKGKVKQITLKSSTYLPLQINKENLK